jgi:hypothetical protein
MRKPFATQPASVVGVTWWKSSSLVGCGLGARVGSGRDYTSPDANPR